MPRRPTLRPRTVNVTSQASFRTFLAPRWLGLHLIFWAAAVGMVLLGRWQLQVSNRRHFDLQNFSYVIQWWFFAAVALLFWARLIRDALRPPESIASGSGLAVQRTGVASYVGPADLITQSSQTGEAPVVYRGYAMPHSALNPARSEDRYHGEYNDFLWQLSLADGAPATQSTPRAAAQSATSTEGADPLRASAAEPAAAIEAAPDDA